MSRTWQSEAKRQLAAGNARGAYDAALQRLSEDRADPDAWGMIALVALENGNLARAIEIADRAWAEVSAPSAMLAGIRGRALLASGRQDEARDLVRDITVAACRDALEADTIGVILARTGLHEAALAFFESAVGAEPKNAQFSYNLATSLQFLGRLEEAKRAYARVIATDKRFYRARLALVQLQTPDEHDLAAIEALLDGARQDSEAALLLGHAAARICEARNDHPAAMRFLLAAKESKAAAVRHDRAASARLFAAATARTVDALAHAPVETDRASPVFVVGMPRSGTTLVERILSSHHRVATAGELPDLALLVKQSGQTPGPDTLTPEVLAAPYDPRWVGQRYRDRTAAFGTGCARLIDKMPFNFFFAAHILESLPDARIVMVRRDPRDTTFANFRQMFASGFGYYDYAYDLEDTAQFVARFVRLADHWKACLPPASYTEVGYEALIADQEGESRRLVEFLGLHWDPACLDFHRNAAPVATASSLQVRAPIHARSIGQWKRYGPIGDKVEQSLREAGIAL